MTMKPLLRATFEVEQIHKLTVDKKTLSGLGTRKLSVFFICILLCLISKHTYASDYQTYLDQFQEMSAPNVRKIALEEAREFKTTKDLTHKYKEFLALAVASNFEGNHTEALRYLVWIFEECPDTETKLLGWVRFHIASNLSALNAPKLSLEYVLPIVETTSEVYDKKLMAISVDMVAYNYFALKNYDKALIYYNRSLQEYKKDKNRLMTASMHNNIGFCLLNQKKFEDAEKTFLVSLSTFEGEPKLNWEEVAFRNIITGNLGTTYDSLGKYALAEKYLNDEINFYLAHESQQHMAPGPFRELMNLYIKTGKSDEADKLISKLENVFGSLLYYRRSINEEPVILQTVYKYYLFKGNTQLALNYASELVRRQEKYATYIQKRTTDMNDVLYRHQLKNLKNEIRVQKVQNESSKNQSQALFWILSLIAVIAIGSLGVYILFSSQMKKALTKDRLIAEQKAEILSNKSEILENDNKLQQEKINNLAMNLNLKKETEKAFLSKILELKRKKNVDTEEVLKDLQISISNLLNVDKKAVFDSTTTDHVLEQFKNKLKKLNPTLSKSDLEYCCYFRLGMSAKEIGSISGQSDGAIRVLKNKIKNKIGLGPDQSLNEYLSEICDEIKTLN